MANVLSWIGNKYMGNSDYDPKTQKIDTTRGDEERALGLESRGQQQDLGQFYQDRIAGKGPSVAELQQARGIKQAMAVGGSGRGTNVALAQRNAATVAQQGVADASMLRAQEQAGYAKQYSEQLQAQRMQDLLARGYSVEEAKAQLSYLGQLQAGKMQAASDQAKRNQGAIGGLLVAGGSLLTSDMSAKQDVEPVGMGLRPEPARGTMLPTAGNPASRSYALGGAMMGPGTMGGSAVGNVPVGSTGAGVADRGQAPVDGSGPTFGQRLGNAFLSMGGGASGNYDPLMQAIRSQQADEAQATGQPQRKEQSGGAGEGLAAMGSILSDKHSKEQIQELKAENNSLKKAFLDTAAGGFLAGGIPGAVAAPVLAHDAASSPQLMKKGAASAGAGRTSGMPREALPLTPEQQTQGAAAFGRLDKPMADRVFQQTVPPLDVTKNRPVVHQQAAGDYARRLEDFRKAYGDREQDLKALENAAAIEAGRLPTPGVPSRGGETPEERRARVARTGVLSDVGGKEEMSDISTKELYPSDERMKTDLKPLFDAIKARGKQMSGEPETGSTASFDGPASGAKASFPSLTDQAAAIPSLTFRYKEGTGEDPSKRYTGTSAQALEQIPATAPTVQTGPDGLKRVDAGKLTMTNTAMLADLARRVEEFQRMISDLPGSPTSKKRQAELGEKPDGKSGPRSAASRGKATTQDLLTAIKGLKSEMPQSESPFGQRTGEIVRNDPYGPPSQELLPGGYARSVEDAKRLNDFYAKRAIVGDAMQAHEERALADAYQRQKAGGAQVQLSDVRAKRRYEY